MKAKPRSLAARTSLFVVLLSGLIARVDAADTPLRWKLKAGETLRYEFHQKTDVKMKTEGGQLTDNSHDLTLELTWKVNSVDPQGQADIVFMVDRVRSEFRIGAQTIKLDSNDKAGDDPGSPKLNAVYRAIAGADCSMQLGARGQVVAARVPDKVAEALKESAFLGMADGGSVFTETGLKSLFGQMIPILPENPVDPGDSWSTTLEVPDSPARLSMTYKDVLKPTDGDTTPIEGAIVTNLTLEPNSPFTMDLKTQSGQRLVSFDANRGRVTLSTIKQKLELTLKVMNRNFEQVRLSESHLKLLP